MRSSRPIMGLAIFPESTGSIPETSTPGNATSAPAEASRAMATYRQLLDWVRKPCDFLTDEQRALILGGTPERYLGAFGLR